MKCIKIFIANTKGKKPFWRAGHRWDYNIKVNIKETVCKDVDWIHVAQVGV